MLNNPLNVKHNFKINKMKIVRITKSAKKVLLSYLSILDYLRVRYYNSRHYKRFYEGSFVKITVDTYQISGMFIYDDTKQGREYWRKIEDGKIKVKDNWFTLLIKKLIIALPFLMLVLITGCTKDKPIEPRKQTVYYEVQCADCLVYLQDDKWNDSNEIITNRSQHFNVQGKFKYSFVNELQDSVNMTVYVSVFQPKQQVYAIAYTNDGHQVSASGLYGFDAIETYPNEKTVTLKLR